MAKALSPAYLRIGGTSADLLIFDENGNVTSAETENSLIDAANGCDCDGYRLSKKRRTKFTMTGSAN